MNSRLFSLFYGLKPVLPRKLQVKLRQFRAKRIFSRLDEPYLEGLDEGANPHGSSECSVLLTHDIESEEGLDLIEPLRKIEREYGVPSTWNFVLKKYRSPEHHIRMLLDEGCECGAHGLYHDGKLFSSRKIFFGRMEEIAELSRKYGLTGFRSPSLHRNESWMKDLPFLWDSSFPAWDPFQPQPGGCRKHYPYRLSRDTWELPVTLFQDFTLFHELRRDDISIWKTQATELAKRKSLINIIVHPDYVTPRILTHYRGFIQFCIEKISARITTPQCLCQRIDEMKI